MQPCDRCGEEAESLVAEPDGILLCPNCVANKPEFTDEEYAALRIKHDKNADFKALRHRFWMLGQARRYIVLVNLGLTKPGELLIEKIERYRLYKLREDGGENDLVVQIEAQEAAIRAENEKAEFVSTRDTTPPDSGRAHAGKVPANRLVDHTVMVQPTNPEKSPWDF